MFDSTMFLAIFPEVLILILAGIILVFDLVLRDENKRILGWLTAGGLVLILALNLSLGRPVDGPTLVWGGMLRFDWLATIFKSLFIFGAVITVLFSMDVEDLGKKGEFYLLLLVSTIGMSLMAGAVDLVMLYLAIETTSIPLYILTGFFKRDDKSTEAGFKYLLFGAMTSAIMLYGFSLLYGFYGSTSFMDLTRAISGAPIRPISLFGSLFLILVGFSFKVSAFPFHFWAPDVYEGAPTPIAGFLSTASKAAGFAVLVRVLTMVFPAIGENWQMMVAIVATASMTVGNFIALTQHNIKRLLAYSSIAHAGYMLVGVASNSALGSSGVTLYLIAYMVTNLAAFGIVAAYKKVSGSDEIQDYAALSRRSPYLALAMLIAFLSLAGMPPFGGFVAKVLVFAAAVQADMIWLAFVGVLNSIVGLYYYLVVLKVVYLYRSEQEDQVFSVSRPYRIALAILCLAIILIGAFFAPWYNWSTTAAAALF